MVNKAASREEERSFSLVSLSYEQGNFSQKSPIRILLRFYLLKLVLYIPKQITGNENRVTMISFLDKAEFMNAKFRVASLLSYGEEGSLGQNHFSYSEGKIGVKQPKWQVGNLHVC